MTATVTEDMQEHVLGVVRKGHELTLDAVRKAVEAVSAAQAKLPAAPHFKLAELRTKSLDGKLPQLRALPKPKEVVTSSVDFLGKLLAEQRKFNGELVAALHPVKLEADAEDDE